jgi:hypothetical protein
MFVIMLHLKITPTFKIYFLRYYIYIISKHYYIFRNQTKCADFLKIFVCDLE